MIRSNVKKQAERFIRDFKYFTPSYSALREIIQKQGYTIVEFNNIYNDENVTLLLESLHLDEYAERSKGFTYADSRRRLLFLNEDLSEDEKLMVLAHEEGHIYCNHFSSVPIIGKDVVEEHEANEFAHHILNQGLACKIKRFPNEHRKATWVCISLAVVLVVGLVLTGIVKPAKKSQ